LYPALHRLELPGLLRSEDLLGLVAMRVERLEIRPDDRQG
jgi:hypothetical protein